MRPMPRMQVRLQVRLQLRGGCPRIHLAPGAHHAAEAVGSLLLEAILAVGKAALKFSCLQARPCGTCGRVPEYWSTMVSVNAIDVS